MHRPGWLTPKRKQSEDFRSSPTLSPSLMSPTNLRRRWGRLSFFIVLLAGTALLTTSHYGHLSPYSSPSHPPAHAPSIPPLPLKMDVKPKVGAYHPSRVLRGPPTERFRDNLLPDVQYLTGWIGGGHTNDFMTYINYIYLGWLTRRVPIIGPFAPTHVGFSEDLVPFGDIFDVERLATEIGFPVVEWRDVKKAHVAGKPLEPLGGWTIWARYDTIRNHLPRGNKITEPLGLDVSYTNTPERLKLVLDQPRDAHVSFQEVARLSAPYERLVAIHQNERFRSEGSLNHDLPPDEHVMTIDFAYFIGQVENWEWDKEWSEPWRIASHAHFTPRLMKMALDFLMRHFHVDKPEAIPKFIVIHARHGDFGEKCEGRDPFTECYASMEVMNTRVQEVQNELGDRPGYQKPDGSPIKLPVLMTSDERDPDWWESVRKQGWSWIDHGPEEEDTAAKYGKWYPVLIDIVIQSMGHGFVGTDQSTMSVVAARRVEAWQHGATRLFRFGHPGADDHAPQLTTSRTVLNNRFY